MAAARKFSEIVTRLPEGVTLLLVLGLAGAIGLGDYLTDLSGAFTLLYLLPISVATLCLGPLAGGLVAVVCVSLSSLGVSSSGSTAALLANHIGELGVFSSVVLLLTKLRAQAALVLEETAAAHGLGLRLSKAVEQAAEGVVITDVDGRIQYVNPAFTTITGYGAEEVLGQTPRLLNSGVQDSGYFSRLWATIRAGRVWRGEIVNRRKSGALYVEEMSIAPVRTEGDQITHFIAIKQDITERKRTEEDLRRTQFAVDHSADAVFWIARDGSFRYANDSACRNLCYEREELTRLRVWDLDGAVSADTWADHWQATKTAGSTTREGRHRRRDGTTFPVEVAINHVEFSGEEYHCTFVRDISQRKAREAELLASAEALRDSEAVLRGFFDSGPWMRGVFDVVGDDLRLVAGNRAAAGLFGTTTEGIAGRSAGALGVSHDTMRLWLERCVESERSDQPVAFEYLHEAPAGSRWLAADVVRIGSGRVRRFAFVFEDVTQRRLLEDQLRQSQKMEAVGQLAGGVAHDFNNLLGVILGYTEMLLRDKLQAPSARQKLEQVSKAAQRAASLTRQLLAFSRKQVLEPRPLDLNAVLSDVEKMLRRLIGEDVELGVVRGTDLGQVQADPGQIEQVILNLAVNARDAMPDGGRLAVETANVEIDAVYGQSHPPVTPGRYVLVAVSDTGCGMSPEVQKRIFEPFFTTKEPGKGTGLGLATVYGVVKQSGGFVWVYSEIGRGTTFKIYLPRIDDVVVTGVCDPPESASTGSETILLVEDEEPLRDAARELLESGGYTVLSAGDADEAIAVAERHAGAIDLLLTDVVMPGMNGRALAERLVMRLPHLKVLFMSGYTDDVIAHRGVLDPGTLLLAKPFSGASLTRKVREAIGTSGTSALA